MRKLALVFVFALLLIALPVTAQDAGELRVDAGESLGTINPYVYGSNSGFYSVIAPNMIPQAEALGMNYVRLGGTYSDEQDLRTSVIDLFVIQARQIGAEPALTVRLLGSTPEAAAALVRYVNIEKAYNVRYWSIGNEPNLFGPLLNTPYTTEDLNREWRAMAEAMLEVDPDIMLVGPDLTQYVILSLEGENIEYLPNSVGGHPVDSEGRDWLREFLLANGDLVDIIALHRYPFPGFLASNNQSVTIDGLRASLGEWDISIPNLRQLIRDTLGRDLPIAITEVNSNSNNSMGGEASLDSHYNAIWFADVLGRLIRQQVDMVLYWSLATDSANGFGLIERYDVRPAYYTYMMYTHFGTELLAAESADSDVSIYAAKREDGTLTLLIVNLSHEAADRTLVLNNFTPAGDAEVWLFDAAHKAEQVESQTIDNGAVLRFPGQSVTMYAIPSA